MQIYIDGKTEAAEKKCKETNCDYYINNTLLICKLLNGLYELIKMCVTVYAFLVEIHFAVYSLLTRKRQQKKE